MKKMKTFKMYGILGIALLAASCEQEGIQEEIQQAQPKENLISNKVMSAEDEEKFLKENGFKLLTTVTMPERKSTNKVSLQNSTTIKEMITAQNLQQMGLSSDKIVNLYKKQFGGNLTGVIVNNYKTDASLVRPASNNSAAYVKTTLPVINSFNPTQDNSQVIYSATTIYNSTSKPLAYSKTLTFSDQLTLTNNISVAAGLNIGGKITIMISSPTGSVGLPGGVSIPLPFIQATTEASIETTLSTTKSTTTTSTKGTTISETISPTIPPNKKLYIVAIQKVQKGAISYTIPVSLTGSVITKQAGQYINRQASFLETQSLSQQQGVINYGYNSDTKIYVKELGLNENPPNL